MMLPWLDTILNIIWPIASTLTPVILGAGFVWLKSQFPTRGEVSAIEDRVTGDFDALQHRIGKIESRMIAVDQRVQHLAQDADETPTRIELLREMGSVSQRLSGVEATVEAVDKRLSTQNDYLHTLIQKGLSQ